MELIAFPIGHAGTTITRTLHQLTTTFSAVRPLTGRPSTSVGDNSLAMDHNAKAHDYTLFKSLLDSLTDLAQARLLGIITNRKRLVDTVQGGFIRNRAHSDASPAHLQATPQQEAATHTLRTRTTRAPKSTAIT